MKVEPGEIGYVARWIGGSYGHRIYAYRVVSVVGPDRDPLDDPLVKVEEIKVGEKSGEITVVQVIHYGRRYVAKFSDSATEAVEKEIAAAEKLVREFAGRITSTLAEIDSLRETFRTEKASFERHAAAAHAEKQAEDDGA